MSWLKSKHDISKPYENEKPDEVYLGDQETLGEADKFHQLGWKKLTVCLIVAAIALGSLSIPSAFATLGMVAGVILCVTIGTIAIYTSYVVGQVRMRYPHVLHYADAVEVCHSVSIGASSRC